MVLTIYGLFRQRSASSTILWKSLYKHGVIYYVTTIAVNAPNLVCASDKTHEMRYLRPADTRLDYGER